MWNFPDETTPIEVAGVSDEAATARADVQRDLCHKEDSAAHHGFPLEANADTNAAAVDDTGRPRAFLSTTDANEVIVGSEPLSPVSPNSRSLRGRERRRSVTIVEVGSNDVKVPGISTTPPIPPNAQCRMTRKDLSRLLERAESERNEDMFHCYFTRSDELLDNAPLCSLCGKQIGQHGDATIESPNSGLFGGSASSRMPRVPVELKRHVQRDELVDGYPRVGTSIGAASLFIAAVALAGLVAGILFLELVAVVVICVLAGFLSLLLSSKRVIVFDKDNNEIREEVTRALLPCCAHRRVCAPFRDIQGVVLKPLGHRMTADPGDPRSAYEAYALLLDVEGPDTGQRFVVLELYVPAHAVTTHEADWNFYIVAVTGNV